MKKVLVLAFLTAIAIFYLKLAGESTPETDGDQVLQEEPIQVIHQEYYPLTGLEYSGAGSELSKRPIAVVIENTPEARPQSGLEDADIVFEFFAEGNITRFVAMYQSKNLPEKIGPVRSARPYFLETAKGYDAFFVAHGYSDTAKSMLDGGFIDNINGMKYDGIYFNRSADRVAPHNSYTSGENISNAMGNLGYSTIRKDIPSYEFYNGEGAEGGVKEILVSYGASDYDNVFIYNGATNKYTRYVDGQATVEVSNVMVISAEHGMEPNGSNRTIDLKSGGKCFLFRNGNEELIEWKNVGGKITPFNKGTEEKLARGTTWVNVLPNSDFESMVKF